MILGAVTFAYAGEWDDFMNKMTEYDYNRMINIMHNNGYEDMVDMMESIGREEMIQMHNLMRDNGFCH